MKPNTIATALLSALLVWLTACTGRPEAESVPDEREAYAAFFREKSDSISITPRRLRTEALQRMKACTDSVARFNYLALASKTCLITSDMDSAQLLVDEIKAFADRQPLTPDLADLRSECANMQGNICARLGDAEGAIRGFREAYELRMKGSKVESVPDILINLADAYNRVGRLDTGAAWYRRALLLCDSLQLVSTQKTPIYYGLAQIYVALRDFERCDHYYDLAALGYEAMLPFEKHFYLNNRGTSYYYRGAYETALRYFEQVVEMVRDYPDMAFELNLSYLNMSDCFLQMGRADSAARYIGLCEPFFRSLGITTALYYLDTQHIELALLRKNLAEARRLLTNAVTPPDIDPDMVHIRNRYLQQYYEEAGDYPRAYHYLKENTRLDDSVRNERIRMRTADLALHYQQDSTLMAQQVFIQEQKNELLSLQQTKAGWITGFALVLLVAGFYYVYSKKRRALMQAENRRTVSTLRLENIRNRLSPHFVFNVLNQQLAGRSEEERGELTSLVKLMRRNLELAEQLCVTLAEELDFVKTYIELERPSLEPDFCFTVDIDPAVNPSAVMLPSMLIQIPVENAVKHALRGKEGAKRLTISIARRDDAVSITVTDNGGGFRPQSRNRGTGTGMKVIMQTIQILNGKNKQAIDVAVHNVTLPDGDLGCQVSFLLPDRYDYTL